METDASIEQMIFNATGMTDLILLLLRFSFNLLITWVIIHFLYYRRSGRRDYYFTFSLISIAIFFMIFMLGSIKLKIGFALGLFAIFGIIRYRTESMPVREMTYLFVIIALSVINALAEPDLLGNPYAALELVLPNVITVFMIWLYESNKWLTHYACKYIQYDKIDLVTPQKRDELIADLEQRTGIRPVKVEVGSIDFLRDSAIVKMYYEEEMGRINSVNDMMKLPKPVEK
ncbi:MAG: DUF4956 domain-containing protein [Bacteroides sp.]|nr:DUF4956 domain-containing protein [Bacteroides sp.]